MVSPSRHLEHTAWAKGCCWIRCQRVHSLCGHLRDTTVKLLAISILIILLENEEMRCLLLLHLTQITGKPATKARGISIEMSEERNFLCVNLALENV
jgi:hypothetical protein